MTYPFFAIIAMVLLDPDTYIYIGYGILTCLSLVGLLVAWRVKRRWLRWTIGGVLALLWLTQLYGAHVGPCQLTVRHVELAFDDLPPAFDGYRIVQFSDVHAGSLTGSRRQLLERAVDSINAQQADLVVFTGDLQNAVPDEIAPFREILSGIQAADGIYSVLGNHDYPIYVKAPYEIKEEYLHLRKKEDRDMGWNLLVNTRRYIHRGGDSIVIAGMDNDGDGKRFPQMGNVPLTLYMVSRDEFVVMLEHDPTAWRRKILPQCHAQLTLSGHTHGGQAALFGWSAADFAYTESYGLYAINNRYIYVSGGLGGVVPFRLGVTPEITVITLKSNRKKESDTL